MMILLTIFAWLANFTVTIAFYRNSNSPNIQQRPLNNENNEAFIKLKSDYENKKLTKYDIEKFFRKSILAGLLKGQKCNERVSHPSDPSKFIVCLNDGDYTILDCPSGLVYNRHVDRCEYSLDLPAGFRSLDVNSASKACFSNPCKYGGKCVDLNVGEYTCECSYGYLGKNCEEVPNYCQNNPCGEIGKCNLMPPKSTLLYYCTCFNDNYFGATCDPNNLERNPCVQNSNSNSLPHSEFHPISFNSQMYVHCDGATLHLKVCSANLEYSSIHKRCEWSAS